MRFDHTVEFPAPPDRVAAMLADRDFTDRRVRAAGATKHDASISSEDDGAFVLDVDATIPTTIIPATYRGLVGDSFVVRIEERWSAAAADDSRSAEFSLNVSGVPARVNGTQALRPVDGGTALDYRGDVTCSIPLLGRKIESAVVGAVDTVLEAERRVGLAFLAEQDADGSRD
ncbi:MAG: DUF2505 domain-containing protein [Actinomycetaceae bacterium]